MYLGASTRPPAKFQIETNLSLSLYVWRTLACGRSCVRLHIFGSFGGSVTGWKLLFRTICSGQKSAEHAGGCAYDHFSLFVCVSPLLLQWPAPVPRPASVAK